jgi:branched-chain amino acid transport system permease protein
MPYISSTTTSLAATDVSKAFGGTVALSNVALEVRQGEVLGLIGPNGSGKTTLLNIMSGVLAADTGKIQLGASDVSAWPSHRRARAGIARTFQNLRLFGRLSVRQNVGAALASSQASQGLPRNEDDLLELVGLAEYGDRKAESLSYAHQRRLELARALGLGPTFLLLDEPSAGMGEGETKGLAATVREVVDRFGCGVLCVDHDMQLIAGISDRICVLQQGRVIATGAPNEVRVNPAVIDAYLGAAWSDTEEENQS